ncbi:MAG: NAD(P)/FAD-dependent oxidoreductase [Anaerolineales bacterium]|nr:NAD(P)/FAD-dependent oxidoreductase [Anaerolineales bacterium]
MREINVAGAGPSGLTAAINLAKAGYTVNVFEKRSDAGKRFHGDVQGLENWSEPTNVLQDLQRMNIAVNFDCDPFLKQITTNGSRSRISHYPPESPLCYLVKRGAQPGSLDQGLKAQALAAGVNVHFSQTIPLEEADIVATGPISHEIFAVDKGVVFRTSYGDTNIFLVNDAAAYKGYAYLLITKGYGCLCTVLFDKFERLDACFETSKQMLRDAFPFDMQEPKPVAGIGCFSTQNVFQKGKSLYVGEAAGLQDLMWGFGIRTAVYSGYVAANCIINHQDYARVAEALFVPRQKATLASRFMWELVRFNNYALVVGNTLDIIGLKSFELPSLYNFGPLQKLIYGIALPFVRRRYPKLRI